MYIFIWHINSVMGQYYIGAYVSLVPRLTLLNLEQIGLTNMLLNRTHSRVRTYCRLFSCVLFLHYMYRCVAFYV